MSERATPAQARSSCWIVTGNMGAREEGEWVAFPPSAMTGKWTPDFCAEMRDTTLPVEPALEFDRADVAVASYSRHDGTHLATWQLVSKVTQHAEQYAARTSGAWTISPVYLNSGFDVAEHPRWQQDSAVVYLRNSNAEGAIGGPA